MSYYLLPHISNTLDCSDIQLELDNKLSNNICKTTHRYLSSLKKEIESHTDKWDIYKKFTNTYEYIHTQIPSLKHSISKYKPVSRAYFKFVEIANIFDIIPDNRFAISTFHLCEGPGGFIEAICHLHNNNNDKFYGMTLIGNDENIKLYTYLLIKEDSHSLYGFFKKSERSLFKLLISVSGVGASTARMMLSSLSPSEIISAIMSENVQVVQSIKGIGLKTAQRIILELKDKVLSLNEVGDESLTLNKQSEEASSALEVLGYSRKQTSKLLSKIISENPGINVESIIKKALNKL